MNNESIPGVIPLIERGIAIYKEELKTLVGLNALYIAFSFLGLAAFIGSLLLVAASLSGLGILGLGLMSIVGLIVMVLFWWLLLRILLASLYTIRDYDEHLSIREAFARGRGKVLGFLWVMILTLLVVAGSMICLLVVGSIILFPFYFVAPQLVGAIAILLLWLGVLAAFLITGTWFAFSTWLYIDQDAWGMHALAVSKHLSHKHLGAVMWRIFCIGVIYVGLFIVVRVVLGAIFSFVPYPTGPLLAQLIANVVVCLTLVPILYASMFSLYTSVEANQVIDVDSRAHGEHRGILITLAVFGFLGLCFLPVILGLTMPRYRFQGTMNQRYMPVRGVTHYTP